MAVIRHLWWTAGALRAEWEWGQAFTGPQVTQFASLLKGVRERAGADSLRGRP